MPRRQMTIRRSLLLSLVLLILLTSGAILAVTVVAGVRAVEDLSATLIEQTLDRSQVELEQFFGSVQRTVLVGRSWAAAGLLDATDPEGLNALFVPLLEQNPHFSSMMVADSAGAEYLLLRDALDPNVWVNRVVQADVWGTRVFNRRWNSATGRTEESWSELDYDPRRRLWYRDALATTPDAPLAWTPPAIFFVTKDPGVTAGTNAPAPGADGRTLVVAFDLLLMDVSRFTTGLEVGEQGVAFVLVEDAAKGALRVVGLPRDSRYPTDAEIRQALLFTPPAQAVADAVPELPRVGELGVRALADAADAWNASGRPERPVRYDGAAGAWWAGFRPFPVGVNTFWIGVAVPESDFLGEVTRQSQVIGVIAFGALLVSFFVATWLARTFGTPLEGLARASRRIRDLDLAAAEPVTSRLREVSELASEQERMRATLDSFARYVPVDLVKQLLARGEAARIGGHRQALTILFTDIQGFTTVSERLTPEDLTAHMTVYFEALLDTIRAHHGEVNQLLGDGVMAYWGAPSADPDHARHAVEGVLASGERLDALDRDWRARGRPELPTRFGLASGQVVVGNVGSPSRLAYAAVGDAVNLASRIEGLSRFYGTRMLASGEVRAGAGAGLEWRHVDGVRAKGKTEPVELYEPLGRSGEVAPARLEFRDAYERALELYRRRAFADAIAVLDALDEDRRSDLSVRRLRALAQELEASPPDESWDGITDYDVK